MDQRETKENFYSSALLPAQGYQAEVSVRRVWVGHIEDADWLDGSFAMHLEGRIDSIAVDHFDFIFG